MSVSSRVARRLGEMRQTGSLCIRGDRAVRTLIARTQGTRLGPLITPQTFELGCEPDALASGTREYEDGTTFFDLFEGALEPRDLEGADVLDLGCGYGGRTVYYAELGARHVSGIEIAEPVVQRCARFAESRGASNVDFQVGFAEALPFPDDAFDTILCFDVLEHVEDPLRALREARRVLRPGGQAWFIFPTYLGARSSHLDYVTQVPMLHRIFDPDTLIEVVNEFLLADPGRYGTNPQPAPRVGPLGRRKLPALNGASRREAMAMMQRAGLDIRLADGLPLVSASVPYAGAPAVAALLAAWARRRWLPDLLIGHLRFHVERPR